MSATTWLIIATLLLAAFGTYRMLARETGFKILEPTADGKPRFAVPEGLRNLFTSSNENSEKTWWNKKDLESQRWFLYTALAVLAITAVYVTPDKYSGYRFIVGGWIVLLGLHLVIWPLFTEKISPVTKVVITGFILFFIVAVVLPNATQMEVANVKEKIASFDRNYGEPTASQATQQAQPAVATAMYHPQTRVVQQMLHAEPYGPFQTVETPAEQTGRVSWSCPRGCIVELQHEGDLLCSSSNAEAGGVYQNVPCKVVVIGQTSTGDKIYREQFLQKLGTAPLNTPRNLMHIITSFGTTEEIGPIDVKVGVEVTETTRS